VHDEKRGVWCVGEEKRQGRRREGFKYFEAERGELSD
jgi:hypothetical protein